MYDIAIIGVSGAVLYTKAGEIPMQRRSTRGKALISLKGTDTVLDVTCLAAKPRTHPSISKTAPKARKKGVGSRKRGSTSRTQKPSSAAGAKTGRKARSNKKPNKR